MKFQLNAEYDYTGHEISEANGYTKWYDWNTVKKHTNIMNLIIWFTLTVGAFLFREQLNIYGITSMFVGIFSAIVIWLIIITPLHEILHLLPLSKGKLDDKCIISINIKAVSALYNEHCSRTQHLICLILPFLFLGAILTFAVFLSNGIWRLFFVFLLIMSCYGSYTDIYMFFYVVKHVRKNEMIFGLYKK